MLPQKLSLPMMQTTWASQLDPIISNPILNGNILKNVALSAGANQINHLLGRNLQGWYVIRMRNNFAQIYDTQDSNQLPSLTLSLVSSASVNVDIAVF